MSQMAVVQPVAGPPRHRGGAGRTALIVLGAVALVAGVVLWLLAGRRYDDAIASLAPAPVGCATTLAFDDAGTYTFFVETEGSVGEIEGDCAGSDRDYEYEGDALPRVSLTLLDDGGEEVELDRVDEPSYDRGGRSGTAVRTAELEGGGTYLLTVEANDPDVMIRVGKDPHRGVGAMRISGLVLVGLGLAALIAGLVRGRRRPATIVPGAPPAAWQPAGGPPPVAPPYAHQPGAPPYGRPPPSGPVWGTPGSAPPPPPPPRGPSPPPPPPR